MPSKFDHLISETESTLWPIPGQDMHNRAVTYKSLPSIQELLLRSPDTDTTGIINSAPVFAAPLTNVINDASEVYRSLQVLKSKFIDAKSSPVYQGRGNKQKALDILIDNVERIEKFLVNSIVEELNNLSPASLNDKK